MGKCKLVRIHRSGLITAYFSGDTIGVQTSATFFNPTDNDWKKMVGLMNLNPNMSQTRFENLYVRMFENAFGGASNE